MRFLESPLAQRCLAVLDVASWLLAILVLLVGRYDFRLAPAKSWIPGPGLADPGQDGQEVAANA